MVSKNLVYKLMSGQNNAYSEREKFFFSFRVSSAFKMYLFGYLNSKILFFIVDFSLCFRGTEL